MISSYLWENYLADGSLSTTIRMLVGMLLFDYTSTILHKEIYPHVEIYILKIMLSVKQLKDTKVIYHSDKLKDKTHSYKFS